MVRRHVRKRDLYVLGETRFRKKKKDAVVVWKPWEKGRKKERCLAYVCSPPPPGGKQQGTRVHSAERKKEEESFMLFHIV